MEINIKKCDAWCEMLLAIMALTKKLNRNEKTYIKANFKIAMGNLELQELEAKNAKYC